MSLTPITRKENFMARAAGNPGLELEPITREEHFLQDIVDAQGGGGGGGNAVLYTPQTLTDEQKTQARNNIGGAASSSVSSLATVVQGLVTYNIAVSGTTPTVTPAANRIYKCGELTSLAITDPPATGAYSIVFTSGSTATTTTIPATILGLENFAAEANTLYEINVLDNRAVIGSWAVPAAE